VRYGRERLRLPDAGLRLAAKRPKPLPYYALETICLLRHYRGMPWMVLFHADFEPEFRELPEAIQDELLARLGLLREFGPSLGRPNVDTLGGSSFPNMKELRFRLDGLWRFAFAFDPQRQAIVLVGGNKEGERQRAFYEELIRVADERFAAHVASLKLERKK
jgi:hypothetical protein